MSYAEPQGALASSGGVLTVPSKFQFSGTGLGLFSHLFVGYLLTLVTLGLYLPWFICRMAGWILDNTTLTDRRGNHVNLQFSGSGGELFGILFLGIILTVLTLGIYGFWFTTRIVRFYLENTDGVTSDGQAVEISFTGTGIDLFANLFLGYVLTFITFGIYSPWFFCRMHRWFYKNTLIYVGNAGPIRLRFVGTGGALFVTLILGYILTILTLGIYSFWLHVQLMQFKSGNTEITTAAGNKLASDFDGTGGEYALICIVGYILTVLTLGLYGFRFVVKLIQFQVNHQEIRAA